MDVPEGACGQVSGMQYRAPSRLAKPLDVVSYYIEPTYKALAALMEGMKVQGRLRQPIRHWVVKWPSALYQDVEPDAEYMGFSK